MRTLSKFGLSDDSIASGILSGIPAGDYTDPTLYGTTRIWWDATNTLFRSKIGSDPASETDGAPESHLTQVYGDESDGAVANATDVDIEATTIAQSGVVTPASNRIWRATGNVTLTQTVDVVQQDGQARSPFPLRQGSPGIELGAIMAAIGSKGMPVPIRPGGDGTGLIGGIIQIISGGDVSVGAAMSALGTNASGDGGGGGGIVIIVAAGTISGASAIDVSAGDGHATAAAQGGGGGYSGGWGGHGGWAGAGGGDAYIGRTPGASGAGYKVAQAGGGGYQGGGGGGCIDAVGVTTGSTAGGAGGDGTAFLNFDQQKEDLTDHWTDAVEVWNAAVAGSNSGCCAGGAAGVNGGGGGGGGGRPGSAGAAGANGGAGGDAGSGGGAGGACNITGTAGNGGAGAAGSNYAYSLTNKDVFTGMPGGQGGGGGGGLGKLQNGCSDGSAGAGGAGGASPGPFVGSMGNGSGGAGGTGETPSGGDGDGGDGGDGGNGGGGAGLVILVAPTITYNGTVTGKLVKIAGTDAENILRSVFGS